jgi:predicted metalloendopeptidase
MQQVKAKKDFRRLRKVIDRHAWSDYLPPTVVNALYDPSINTISKVFNFHLSI